MQGYAIGNGVTDDEVDGNAIVPFAYRKALLSTELYTKLMQECQGNFWNATKGEAACYHEQRGLHDTEQGHHTLQALGVT